MALPKKPIYVLPYGIEVIGEYPARGKNPYVRLRIRPHPFFPHVKVRANGISVRKSRVVLSAKLGRALSREELAHHDDENRENDSVGNLELVSPAEHNRLHKTGSKHRADSKAKTTATLRRLYAEGIIVPNPVRGSKQWCAKLNEKSASIIKHSKEKTRVLVKRYGVSRTIIKGIRRGQYWRHVK